MNILVTGANGFIGRALTKRLLSDGDTVFAIVTSSNEMTDLACDNLKVFELFFNQYHNLAELVNSRIDIAYHFAWQGLSGEEARNVDIQLQNVKATFVLLEQLHILGVKKFVFASTMNTLEVRGALANPLLYSPRQSYVHVAAKINAEIIARTFCFNKSIEYNEGIIAMAYGEGNKSRMVPNVFIFSLLNGIVPKLVKGDNKYDLIYIEDIVDAFVKIGLKGVDRKSYYIGHNWDKTFKEIFLEIKDIINPDATIEFGTFSDDNAINFDLINRSELSVDTNWRPTINFKQSIVRTAEWIKKSGFKIDE